MTSTAKTFIVTLVGEKKTYTPTEYDGRVHVRPSSARLTEYVREFEARQRDRIVRASVVRRATGEVTAGYPTLPDGGVTPRAPRATRTPRTKASVEPKPKKDNRIGEFQSIKVKS